MNENRFLLRIKTFMKFLLEGSKRKPTPPFLIATNHSIIAKGRESYHNGNFIVKGNLGKIVIGSYCAIGQDVKVILSNHDMTKTVMQYTFYRKNFGEKKVTDLHETNIQKSVTKIDNDVWIGDNVIILPGVHIYTGAIIAAGAVVSKDVPPYGVVGGVPAKLIKKRFEESKIQELLASKWWEWDEEKIKNNKDFFYNK